MMKSYITNDAAHDPRISLAKQKEFKIYNLVNVPIINGHGQRIGCFEIHNKANQKPFDSQDAFMLQGLASNAAVALENARMLIEQKSLHKEILKINQKLKKFTLKDTETGLYNHQYLGEIIESEYYRSKRYASPLSLIMIDIDYFRSINELYGHEFGNLVIKQISIFLKKIARRNDVIIRYSGEEFVVISPGINQEKALAFGQRLLDTVSTYDFGNKKNRVRLKLSIAVVSYPHDACAKSSRENDGEG
jgi:diguanylate cyclase (GGDEF)-like protein